MLVTNFEAVTPSPIHPVDARAKGFGGLRTAGQFKRRIGVRLSPVPQPRALARSTFRPRPNLCP